MLIQWGIASGFLLLILLLIFSALISGSEVAFFSLDKNQLRVIEEDGDDRGQRILSLREKPRRLLATILIINNLVNIGIVILSYYLFPKILSPDTLYAWGVHVSSWGVTSWLEPYQWSGVFWFLISIVGITFLLVLFGEVIPKIYANLNNVHWRE